MPVTGREMGVVPRLSHAQAGAPVDDGCVVQFPNGRAQPITQQQIVEYQMLESMIRKQRKQLADLVEKRNKERERLIRMAAAGAPVEPGPHTIDVRHVLRHALIVFVLPIAFVTLISMMGGIRGASITRPNVRSRSVQLRSKTLQESAYVPA